MSKYHNGAQIKTYFVLCPKTYSSFGYVIIHRWVHDKPLGAPAYVKLVYVKSIFLKIGIFNIIIWWSLEHVIYSLMHSSQNLSLSSHDDVIKWKHFPCYWPFVQGIHRSPVNSLHKGQWHGALMFSFICAWINGWVNDREAGDLRRHHDHYDVIVMIFIVKQHSDEQNNGVFAMHHNLWLAESSHKPALWCNHQGPHSMLRCLTSIGNLILEIRQS